MGFWDSLDLRADRPRHVALCDALAEGVGSGRLAPGRRLPSHRTLARLLRMSVGTVTRAYEEAIERGLITGKVGRGTYVCHRPPPPLSVVDSSRYPGVRVDLYQNFPVPIGDVENEAWAETLSGLVREADLAEMNRASWSEVSRRHQRAGVAWIGRTGLTPPLGNVLDCPGVQAALSAILGGLTRARDALAAPSLSHPLIRSLAEMHGLRLLALPMDEQGIEPAAFEALCREDPPALLYCQPTIHSPTTGTMPAERRREIAAIAERHEVLIIEDEHASFLLPDPPLPIAAYAPTRTILIADVWMALSLGLRTAYVLVPEVLRPAVARTVAATSGLTAPLIAEIAAQWIESGTAERLIECRRAELAQRNEVAQRKLGRRRLRSDVHGHHLWLELPPPWTSDQFVARAEQAGIAINGAETFAVGHVAPQAAVRICIGNARDLEELDWALSRLEGLLDGP